MKVIFEKAYLENLYKYGDTKDKKHRFQPSVVNGFLKCVKTLVNASNMKDLYAVRSLNYEHLKGDMNGLSSLRINDRYRLIFREITKKNGLEIDLCSLMDITNHYK